MSLRVCVSVRVGVCLRQCVCVSVRVCVCMFMCDVCERACDTLSVCLCV